MIEPALRGPLAVVAITIIVLGTWRLYGGKPMSLPGDIRYESEGISVQFPWVSCLVLSAFANIFVRAWQGGRIGAAGQAGHRP